MSPPAERLNDVIGRTREEVDAFKSHLVDGVHATAGRGELNSINMLRFVEVRKDASRTSMHDETFGCVSSPLEGPTVAPLGQKCLGCDSI